MDLQTAQIIGVSLAVFSLGFLYLRVALEVRQATQRLREGAR